MSDKQDYYALLGVPRDVSPADLKKAYRKLALKYHPDRNPEDPRAEEHFKALGEAYAVLSDPERRKMYDTYGHEASDRMNPFGQGGFNMDPNDMRSVFGDLFDEIFGSFFRRSPTRHGRDIRHLLTITLEEAASGVEKTVEVQRAAACNSCKGSGSDPDGAPPRACPTCRGMGQVRVSRGFVAMVQSCPDCEGMGKQIVDPCPVCSGSGLRRELHSLTLPIPAGVESGVKLRVDGEGEEGRDGGMAGDLYVEIEVEAHPFFERQGTDLLCEVPISFPQAALGAQIEVPTLDGKVKVKVPSGTQSGRILRLRGKGIKQMRGRGAGDQLVRLHVETPTQLSSRQKALLEEFEALSHDGESPSEGQPRRKGFLDKLKEFFD